MDLDKYLGEAVEHNMRVAYHGTTSAASKSIIDEGLIWGPVYMCASREEAAEYGDVVLEINVVALLVRPDFEGCNDDDCDFSAFASEGDLPISAVIEILEEL